MAAIWIVHRDEGRRAALARLAGLAVGDCVSAAPGAALWSGSGEDAELVSSPTSVLVAMVSQA